VGLASGFPADGPRRAERRQINVLFCDLVNFTALSHRLDPEELSAILTRYRHDCGALIAAFGGHVARYFGDGIMAYFGWPAAHEDDAERALHAGLGLIEAVAQVSRVIGERLSARVGIATGLVVIGNDKEPDGDGSIAGEAPNLAARLQAEARPDTVVTVATTARLAGNSFEYRSLGQRDIKGLAGPLEVLQVVATTPRESRFQARQQTLDAPFVGREEEIELMMERWRQAQAGAGQLILLSGEAGIGKSRLVHELRRRTGADWVLRYQSSPLHTDIALFPVAKQLERAAGLARHDSLEVKLAKLGQALSEARVAVDEHLPLICNLLQLDGARARLPELTPQELRDRLVDCLWAEMRGLCQRGPVLVIVEDAQWLDPTSESLFGGALLRELPGVPMTLVVTNREKFWENWHSAGNTTTLPLERLPDDASRRLVRAVANGRMPEAMEAKIVERAEGIPLYLEELTRSVLQSGPLERGADAGASAEEVPTTLQALLTMRLDQTGAAKHLAQVGAVLGRHFTLHDLKAVASLKAIAAPTGDDVSHHLERLAASGLLQQRGNGAALAFKHALVRDAAYASLLNSEKKRLHRATLDHFEESGGTPPALLAFHAEKGRIWDKAARYLLAACTAAIRGSANREALALYERGLAALTHLPMETAAPMAIDLRLRAFNALVALGELERFVRVVREADALARDHGDKRRQAAVKAALAQALWMAGQHRAGLPSSEDAERLADELDDFVLRLSARYARANLFHALGRIREAVAVYTAMLAQLEGALEFKRFGWPAVLSVLVRSQLAWSHIWLGAFDDAWRMMARAQEVVRQVPEPYSVVYAQMAEGLYHMGRGEPAKAIAAFEIAHRVNTEADILLPIALAWLGGAYALGGRAEEAVSLLLAAERDGSYKSGGMYCWIHHYLALAQAHLALGAFTPARAAVARANEIAEPAEELAHVAWIAKTSGDIEAADPDGARIAALRQYQAAMELARPRGLLPLLAHCHLGLAEVFGRSDEPDTAAVHHAEADRILCGIGLPDWRSRTMRVVSPAALRQAGARPRAPGDPPASSPP
jgi:class 3 adenylate cyclase/tetratricopeptide (TPR) repeat protein